MIDMTHDLVRLSYQRKAPNLGAGSKVELGDSELKVFVRQHGDEVQLASDPVAYPVTNGKS